MNTTNQILFISKLKLNDLIHFNIYTEHAVFLLLYVNIASITIYICEKELSFYHYFEGQIMKDISTRNVLLMNEMSRKVNNFIFSLPK